VSVLAWGAKVSAAFRDRTVEDCRGLGVDPSWLMACMAFESGGEFRPDARNAAGSGAVGLIQFMPQTAAALGTTTEALAAMTAERQLTYVRRYFWPRQNRLKSLGDLYMAILWPGGIGKPDSHVLFDRNDPDHPARYVQNAGLDLDRDGRITRGEACARVEAKLAEGLEPHNAFEI
jgi:hypothetical protein